MDLGRLKALVDAPIDTVKHDSMLELIEIHLVAPGRILTSSALGFKCAPDIVSLDLL